MDSDTVEHTVFCKHWQNAWVKFGCHQSVGRFLSITESLIYWTSLDGGLWAFVGLLFSCYLMFLWSTWSTISIHLWITFWIAVIHGDVLAVHDLVQAVIRHLQNEPAIHHAVPRFQPAVNDRSVVKILHTLREEGAETMTRVEREWGKKRMERWVVINMKRIPKLLFKHLE